MQRFWANVDSPWPAGNEVVTHLLVPFPAVGRTLRRVSVPFPAGHTVSRTCRGAFPRGQTNLATCFGPFVRGSHGSWDVSRCISPRAKKLEPPIQVCGPRAKGSVHLYRCRSPPAIRLVRPVRCFPRGPHDSCVNFGALPRGPANLEACCDPLDRKPYDHCDVLRCLCPRAKKLRRTIRVFGPRATELVHVVRSPSPPVEGADAQVLVAGSAGHMLLVSGGGTERRYPWRRSRRKDQRMWKGATISIRTGICARTVIALTSGGFRSRR